MVPSTDTTSYDSALDNEFKKIYTPFIDSVKIDIIEEMLNLENTNDEPWLRKDDQIDLEYYKNQSERMDNIKREEIRNEVNEVVNYQEYVKNTFGKVSKPIAGLDVAEEYPIFPDHERVLSLGIGVKRFSSEFESIAAKSTLISECKIDDSPYSYTVHNCEKILALEIRNGRAYYRFVDRIYKFVPAEN